MNKRLCAITVGFALFLAVTYGVRVFFARTTLTADGQVFTHYTLQKVTVRDMLQIFDVVLSSRDIVRPELDKKLNWGEQSQVVRVRESAEEKSDEIEFIIRNKRKTTKNLRKVEIQQGHRKKRVWRVHRIFHDGKEVDLKNSVKKVTKTNVTRLVLFTKKGYPEKIYDLSRCKKIRMVATAYWEGDPQVPGIYTYLDHRVRRGLVAVDPTVIPLKTRLYIPGYGYAYASDTGSAIKGNRIDLFVENKAASRKWGHVKVDVYILGKAQEW